MSDRKGPSRTFRIVIGIAFLVAIAIAGTLYYLHGVPRTTPRGQPPLQSVSPGDLGSFQRAFNGAADRTRVLVLLSPT